MRVFLPIRSSILLFLLILFWAWPHLGEAKEIKWGFVDLQMALRSVEHGKAALRELEGMRDERKTILEKEGNRLQAAGEELEKQQSVLSKDAFARKKMDLGKKQFEFQKKIEAYEMELLKAQHEFTKEILTEMEDIVNELGKKNHYDVIFERSSGKLLYADKQNDLTPSVIQRYNDRHKGKPLKSSSQEK